MEEKAKRKVIVDADSVPQALRAIILRRVEKEGVEAVFVADRKLPDVEEEYVRRTAAMRAPFKASLTKEELRKIRAPLRMEVVPTGQDSADGRVVELTNPGDIVITHDIPLAARCVEAGALRVLDDRGGVWDGSNIRARLAERNANTSFREMGLFGAETSRPMSAKDREAFANALDRVFSSL